MKQSAKLAVGIVAATTAALIVFNIIRRKRRRQGRLRKISEEGYETAHDVLYPDNENQYRNLKYGPVLPELI